MIIRRMRAVVFEWFPVAGQEAMDTKLNIGSYT